MASAGPAHALLLRDFANTLDVDEGADALADPAALARWLADHGLVSGASNAERADLDTAIALRTSLRLVMRSHHGNEPRGAQARRGGAESGLGAAAARLPLRVAETASGPVLVPVEAGVRGGLARLAAAVVASAADGSWPRLKICAEDSCQWAFLDSSKNRSKHWCSMQGCGNRAKTRAYRARRAARGPAG